jgi:alpha-L-fucosidase 2
MRYFLILLIVLLYGLMLNGQESDISDLIDKKTFDPATLLWYKSPAAVWEEALPVGNGRLGAMVFGKYGEERIQLNEDTYWTGGPYSTVVSGGYKVLPEIQKSIFKGDPIKAHKLFGRYMMGYPVEHRNTSHWAILY